MQQFLADLERCAERIRSGALTRREVAAGDRLHEPIGRHIAEYVDRLPGRKGGQATPMHRANTRSYLRRLAAACGWTCLADLSRDALERWIASQARRGRSARSINCHRAAAVAFANWCADPLRGNQDRDRCRVNPGFPLEIPVFFGNGRTKIRTSDLTLIRGAL